MHPLFLSLHFGLDDHFGLDETVVALDCKTLVLWTKKFDENLRLKVIKLSKETVTNLNQGNDLCLHRKLFNICT